MNETNKTKQTSNFPSFGGVRGGRFIIAGGGTGGHIFPAIAIANAIKKKLPTAEILFVGAKGKMEMEKVPQAGYQIKGLDIAGFNRSSLIKNIGLPFKLIKSFFQVRKIFNEFKPNAAIGVGGYSTYPVLKLAQTKGIPTFIHESNSFAGKANIMLGKNATKIFVAANGMEKFFPKEKIFISGNPVRTSIAQANIAKAEALAFFNLDVEKKTVLVVGGSLGARSINEAVAKGLNQFVENNIQLIWQTGKTTAQAFKVKASETKGVWCSDFITQMEMAYAAADVIISRAGAMAVTEICVVSKPAIFVPFPYAAEDHQTANAKQLVNNKAALMITDDEAKTKLMETILMLVSNEIMQNEMIRNLNKLAKKNADEIIANEILELMNK